MQRSTMYVILVIVAIGAVIALSYFFLEKPQIDAVQNISYNNLSIAAIADGKNIVAHYTLTSFNTQIGEGSTVLEGYSFKSILQNQSFSIFFESPEIYTSKLDYSQTSISPIRIDAPVDKFGNITLSHYGTFWQDDPLLLILNVTGKVKHPVLCFRWSMGIINAEISELNIIDFDVPKRFNADRCYYLNETLFNETTSYSVYYSKFGEYQDEYLNVIIFDGDITSYSNDTILYQTDNGSDIFMPDVNYEIR